MVARTKILVADDSRAIRTLTQRILAAAGYEVVLACDGLQAVEVARDQRPEVVLLDIQMPAMDGYEACQRILQLPDRHPELRIIFLTKDQAGHLDTLGRQLGAYLPKPVNAEALLTTLRVLLQRRQPAECVEATSP